MLVVENNAIGAIDGAFGSGLTTLTLQSMTGMPVLNNVDEFCILTLIRSSDNALEYVKCTAQDVGAKTYTVVRGQEGSIPLDFVDSDEARNLWTKGQIELVQNESDTTVVRVDGSVAMTANLDLDGNTLDNLPNAVNPQEPTTLSQVEDLIDAIPPSAAEAKVWARISGGGSTPVVDSGSGITSVTRTANGRYEVALTTPIADKTKIIILTTPIASTSLSRVIVYDEANSTTSLLKVNSVAGGGGFNDIDDFVISIEELIE